MKEISAKGNIYIWGSLTYTQVQTTPGKSFWLLIVSYWSCNDWFTSLDFVFICAMWK